MYAMGINDRELNAPWAAVGATEAALWDAVRADICAFCEAIEEDAPDLEDEGAIRAWCAEYDWVLGPVQRF